MGYSTPQDILDLVGEQELIQLSSPAGDAIDYGVVASAIQAADRRIDGTLRGAGYSLPLSADAAAQVSWLSRDIALYNLYGTRINEESSAYLRYKGAVAELDRISQGKVALAVDSDGDGEQDSPALPAAGARDAAYSAATLARML